MSEEGSSKELTCEYDSKDDEALSEKSISRVIPDIEIHREDFSFRKKTWFTKEDHKNEEKKKVSRYFFL